MSGDPVYKQMLVVRKDLNMRKGKIAAQCAHAAHLIAHKHRDDPRYKKWMTQPITKICVSVNSEQELIDIHEKAKDAGLLVELITDAGKTEFNGVPTLTVCAIGPDTEGRLDAITGGLPLL